MTLWVKIKERDVSKVFSDLCIYGGLLVCIVTLLVGHQIQREQIDELRVEINDLKKVEVIEPIVKFPNMDTTGDKR